jgi:hypothetical protein
MAFPMTIEPPVERRRGGRGASTRDGMTRILDVTAARLAEYAGGRETGRWVS